MQSLFVTKMRITFNRTAKVLSPTLEEMRPSMAPCSVSNSCSLCRRPWWSLLQARTDTTDSRTRTTTGPSIKRTKVSTRYGTGSPSGTERRKKMSKITQRHLILYNRLQQDILSRSMPVSRMFHSNIHLLEAETSANLWWCCCCTCPGSSRKWRDGRIVVWSNEKGFSQNPSDSHAQTPPRCCWLWERRNIVYRGTEWPGGIWGYHTDRPAVHLWKRWYEFNMHSCCFPLHLRQQANRKTCVSTTF